MSTLRFEHLAKGSETPDIADGYGGLVWEGYHAVDVTAPNTPTGLVDLQQEPRGSGVAVSAASGVVRFSAPDGYAIRGLEFYVAVESLHEGHGRAVFTDSKGGVFFQVLSENDVSHLEPARIRDHIVSVTIFFDDKSQFGIDDIRFKLTPLKTNDLSGSSEHIESVFDPVAVHNQFQLTNHGGEHALLMPFDGHVALA